jgi:hypothetical protein
MWQLNLWAAWMGVLMGFVSGAVAGLFFNRADWLGGYGSWRRRLMRLGHISFFGLAGINLMFAFTARAVADPAGPMPTGLMIAGGLLVGGAVTMPTLCFLSAWREQWRNLFFVPVGCLIVGVTALITWGAMGALS